MKDQNFFAPFQLICRRADNGEVVWKSADLPDYAAFDLVGLPLLADGKLFIAGQDSGQSAAAARACRSSSCWRSSRTTARFSGRPRSARSARASSTSTTTCPTRRPSLGWSIARGAIYLDTHVGVLAPARRGIRARSTGDTATRRPRSSPDIASSIIMPQEPQAIGGPPLQTGEAFLVKGMQSERLYAVEPNKMKVLWERPITKASRLLGVDDNAVYLGGDELSAVDLEDAEALVGDTRSQRQHGRARPGAAGRPVAIDAPRHLRDRSQVGRRAADLPRQRPGLGRGRPVAHRHVAPGRLQSHDLRLSPPGDRRPTSPPATTPHPQRSRLAMNKPAIAAICLSLVSPARSARLGLSSSTRCRAGGRRIAQYRGVHRRRQGLRRGQARPGRRSTWKWSPHRS